MFQDYLLISVKESRPFTGIYEQNDGQFTLDTTLNMDSLGYSFSEFGDYDSDGTLIYLQLE